MEAAHYELLFTGLMFCKDDAARSRSAAALEAAIDQRMGRQAPRQRARKHSPDARNKSVSNEIRQRSDFYI
jgi:hypothetical protein